MRSKQIYLALPLTQYMCVISSTEGELKSAPVSGKAKDGLKGYVNSAVQEWGRVVGVHVVLRVCSIVFAHQQFACTCIIHAIHTHTIQPHAGKTLDLYHYDL